MRQRSQTAPTGDDQVAPALPGQRRSTPTIGDTVAPVVPGARRSHVGRVVAGSLAAGFVAAVSSRSCQSARWMWTSPPPWCCSAGPSGGRSWQFCRFGSPTNHNAGPWRRRSSWRLSGALVLLAPDAVVDALGWVWPPASAGLGGLGLDPRQARAAQPDPGVAAEPGVGHPGALRPRRGVRDGSVSPPHRRLPCAGSSSTWDRTDSTWSAPAHAVRP